jgi:hypothetical protein
LKAIDKQFTREQRSEREIRVPGRRNTEIMQIYNSFYE